MTQLTISIENPEMLRDIKKGDRFTLHILHDNHAECADRLRTG